MLSLSWVCPIQREIINTALFVSIDQLFDNIILKCKVVVQTFIVDTMSWIDSEAEFSIWHQRFHEILMKHGNYNSSKMEKNISRENAEELNFKSMLLQNWFQLIAFRIEVLLEGREIDNCTLDFGINIGVFLLIFEKFWRKNKIKKRPFDVKKYYNCDVKIFKRRGGYGYSRGYVYSRV